MADTLENILQAFAPFFQCPLPVDNNGACLIKMASGLRVQMELNRYEQFLIGCRLGQPTGAYKQQLFLKALEWHSFFPPGSGVFGLSSSSQQLIFFLLKDPAEIQPDRIVDWLSPFLETAKIWKEAVDEARLPNIEAPAKASSGLFELSQ